jgi:hypothetical protein
LVVLVTVSVAVFRGAASLSAVDVLTNKGFAIPLASIPHVASGQLLLVSGALIGFHAILGGKVAKSPSTPNSFWKLVPPGRLSPLPFLTHATGWFAAMGAVPLTVALAAGRSWYHPRAAALVALLAFIPVGLLSRRNANSPRWMWNAGLAIAAVIAFLAGRPAGTLDLTGWDGRQSCSVDLGVGTPLLGTPSLVAANAVLCEPRLRGLTLDRVNLDNAVLTRPLFTDLTVTGQLTAVGATLDHARLSGLTVRDATFARARLGYAVLSHAKLPRAALSGAMLADANLDGADLSGADFMGADLAHATLRGADLCGARDLRADVACGDDATRADVRLACCPAANDAEFPGGNAPQTCGRPCEAVASTTGSRNP